MSDYLYNVEGTSDIFTVVPVVKLIQLHVRNRINLLSNPQIVCTKNKIIKYIHITL